MSYRRFTANEPVCRVFLAYLLQTTAIEDADHAMSTGHKVCRDHIRAASWQAEASSSATVDEQTAIATVLSDMDAEIAALEARRDKTRALKQGMMQELLTGRIRLV